MPKKRPQAAARCDGSTCNDPDGATSMSYVQERRAAIKKTNSVCEGAWSSFTSVCSPHPAQRRSVSLMMRAGRQRWREGRRGGGPRYSTATSVEEVNSPVGTKSQSHMSTTISPQVSPVNLSGERPASQSRPWSTNALEVKETKESRCGTTSITYSV